MHYSENFLSFIWQFKLYQTNTLYCTCGQRLHILNPGALNKDAGPDFSHAKVKIGDTIWAGNVEIHIKSSDWLLHKHQYDLSFDTVVLHVVYTHDQQIYRNNGMLIPVFELKGLFSEQLLFNFNRLMTGMYKFPCQQQVAEIDQVILDGFLSRVLVERFEEKATEVLQKLTQLKGNWDETFFYFMAKSFGFKVNSIPFELLADSLPQQLFAKHRDQPDQLAALIFGQAGFLAQEFSEKYPTDLKKEYEFLKKKYGLNPIAVSLWKFLRMRPQNFPTVRLAQFTALISGTQHLFSKIIETTELAVIVRLFEQLPVNNYWANHYHFNKETNSVNLQLGIKSIHNIIINAICVLLYAYGKYTDQHFYIERSLRILEQLPAESNSMITNYLDAGVKINSAFMSQAVLQLNKCYCSQKKCLNCGVGIKILKK